MAEERSISRRGGASNLPQSARSSHVGRVTQVESRFWFPAAVGAAGTVGVYETLSGNVLNHVPFIDSIHAINTVVAAPDHIPLVGGLLVAGVSAGAGAVLGWTKGREIRRNARERIANAEGKSLF